VVTECTTMFIIHKLYVVLIQFASVFFMGLEQRVIIHRHNITWLGSKTETECAHCSVLNKLNVSKQSD